MTHETQKELRIEEALQIETNETQNLDLMIRALASPVRRKILLMLKEPTLNFRQNDKNIGNEDGVCVDSIAKAVNLAQSTVSAHLATLERAGFLTSVSYGRWTYFSRADSAIAGFLEMLQSNV
jgi:DNA-binding transcriptional ArsR family regulator